MSAHAKTEGVERRVNPAVLFVVVLCAAGVLFTLAFRAIGLPGIASIGPSVGTWLLADWLNRTPRPPSRGKVVRVGVIYFLVWPAAVTAIFLLTT